MRNTLYIFTLLVLALPVHAAVISITPNTIAADGTTDIEIRIDTEGAVVNALELTAGFPHDAVVLEEVHEARSVISFWTQPARIENNAVALAGIIPGGFQGEGVIMTLRVSGVRDTETHMNVSGMSVLLNDGKGTSVSTRLGDMTVAVSSGVKMGEPSVDVLPPEPFTVWVTQDASMSGGAYVALFATHDKQTGISKYEIQETTSYAPDESAWVAAVSPYILADQTLSSKIFVRATDYAGNVRVEQYKSEKGISMLEGALYLMISLVVVLLLFAFYVRHTHRKKVGLSNV